MQEPTDSDLAVPSIDVIIEVSQEVIAFDQETPSEIAQSPDDGELRSPDEPLNRMERIAANFGAWIVTFADHWHIQGSPYFIADIRPLGDLRDAAPVTTENGPTTPTP